MNALLRREIFAPAAVLLLGLLTILGAWGFQVIGGYFPCKLCLEQRVPYYVGLPVALVNPIFGPDGPERVAVLQRSSLVEVRGADERLDLPAPIRWFAEKRLASDVAQDRQVELLA